MGLLLCAPFYAFPGTCPDMPQEDAMRRNQNGHNGRKGGGGGGEGFRRAEAPPGWRLGVGYARASTEGDYALSKHKSRS